MNKFQKTTLYIYIYILRNRKQHYQILKCVPNKKDSKATGYNSAQTTCATLFRSWNIVINPTTKPKAAFSSILQMNISKIIYVVQGPFIWLTHKWYTIIRKYHDLQSINHPTHTHKKSYLVYKTHIFVELREVIVGSLI